MSVLRSHNNKSRGGLGRVCATGMYRSTEHAKFPKFQTGIFLLNGKRPGSLFVSSCPPECSFQSETKIESDLRLVVKKIFIEMFW